MPRYGGIHSDDSQPHSTYRSARRSQDGDSPAFILNPHQAGRALRCEATLRNVRAPAAGAEDPNLPLRLCYRLLDLNLARPRRSRSAGEVDRLQSSSSELGAWFHETPEQGDASVLARTYESHVVFGQDFSYSGYTAQSSGEVFMERHVTMRRALVVLAVTICSMPTAIRVSAQGCEPIRFTAPVSLGGAGQAYQQGHEWELTLAYRRLVSNEFFVGTRESPASGPFGQPPVFNINTFVADVAYAINDRYRVSVSLPVQTGTISH